jgi:hypothetical protein
VRPQCLARARVAVLEGHHTSHVIVMVPVKAGSSETNSTACTTRTSGTMSGSGSRRSRSPAWLSPHGRGSKLRRQLLAKLVRIEEGGEDTLHLGVHDQ